MITCKQCSKEYEDGITGNDILTDMGKAKAKIYGFEFDNFCSSECSNIYYEGKETISAEEFALSNRR